MESVVWSVVEGPSPEAWAVEPGLAGITVPDEVLEWAAGHGLAEDNTDIYLLVTTADEVWPIFGEVAYAYGLVSDEEASSIRKSLSELGQRGA